MTDRRRELLKRVSGGGGRLPPEFQEVEYIGCIQSDNDYKGGFVINNPDLSIRTCSILNFELYRGFVNTIIFAKWTGTAQTSPYLTATPGNYEEYTASVSLGTSQTMIVFGRWSDLSFSGDWKFSEMVLYDSNGEIVKDYIPCYRKADGEIGVYDIINDEFCTNTGTGTFYKGGDV